MPDIFKSPHIDKYGMICKVDSNQPDGLEGGDSCQRNWAYILLNYMINGDVNLEFIQLSFNLIKGGRWRRHDRKGWCADWDRGSRDQANPLLLYFALIGNNGRFVLTQIEKEWRKRRKFCTNTRSNGCTSENHGEVYKPENITYKRWYSPIVWAYERFVLWSKIPILPMRKGIRNYNWKLPDWAPFWSGIFIRGKRDKTRPLALGICDYFDLYLGAINWQENPSNDVLNFLLKLFFAAEVMPTKWSYKAIQITDRKRMIEKIEEYFDPSECQELKDLYIQACMKYLKNIN